ncbi:MAG: hypothetical protein KDM91_18705 [Verrucomicrobiae bacterium]|nr:hypothetical protein [Verrucomicrobiae bacterium]
MKCLPLLSAAAAALFLNSCASLHCAPEKTAAPCERCFEKISNASHGDKYPFWVTRSPGKPVLLLHAMNGLSPRTLELAREMEGWGCRVYLPSLYGPSIKKANDAYGFDDVGGAGRYLKKSPDWNTECPGDAGQILDDIRGMAGWVSRREGGRDVVVIGNCLTGMYPLVLMDEPFVKTVVLCQPATPLKKLGQVLLDLPQKPGLAAALGLPEEQVGRALDAMGQDRSKRVVGFHYTHDPLGAFEKFNTLSRRLGERGLGDRFATYLLAPMADRDAVAASGSWTEVGTTHQRRTLLLPHSTIINAATPCDRWWFREHLRAALAAP